MRLPGNLWFDQMLLLALLDEDDNEQFSRKLYAACHDPALITVTGLTMTLSQSYWHYLGCITTILLQLKNELLTTTTRCTTTREFQEHIYCSSGVAHLFSLQLLRNFQWKKLAVDYCYELHYWGHPEKTCSSSATCSSCHTAVMLTTTTINALLKFPCSRSVSCSSSHTAVTLLHYYKNCTKNKHVAVTCSC
jgi:hypothetical protein